MTHTGRASILCVETSAPARVCLESALRAYDCSFACNASEAIRTLNGGAFDAYLLDYWMPDWSGPPLCREVRKHDPHGPVILCTDTIGDVHRSRALHAGASAYLPKPIDPPLLLETLGKLLRIAESDSLRATGAAEHALREELKRRGVARAIAEVLALGDTMARSVERTARSRTCKAFIEAGGTRAHFERWWAVVWKTSLTAVTAV